MVIVQAPPSVRQSPAALALSDLCVCPFTVAIDTREQAPWGFQGITLGGKLWVIPREVRTLQTGDYSIVGHEDQIAIERKSQDDFLGSITSGNARFRREHERMAAIVEAGGFAAVVVEGCMAAICEELDSPTSERRITSDVVLGITAAWPRRFGVHWLFAGDRRRAELLAWRILWKWWEEVGRGNQI